MVTVCGWTLPVFQDHIETPCTKPDPKRNFSLWYKQKWRRARYLHKGQMSTYFWSYSVNNTGETDFAMQFKIRPISQSNGKKNYIYSSEQMKLSFVI